MLIASFFVCFFSSAGECLHYCQPGPIDEWHKILFHQLAIKDPVFVHHLEAAQAPTSEKNGAA